MLTRISAPLVRWSIYRTLRGSLRRVCWVGGEPVLPAGLPVIVYANHNHFLDGHILWLVCREVLRRPFIIWMEELDRFPFFASAGALPFPADDPARRSTTLRQTRAALAAHPPPALAYFPGGVLTPPESGLPAEDPRTFLRLSRIMPPAAWLPLAIHVTWWGEDRPTVLVSAGDSHGAPAGDEMRRLGAALEKARAPNPVVTQALLEGRRGLNEKWNLSFLRRLYRPC